MSAGDEVAHTKSPALNKTRDGRRRNKPFAKVQGRINGSLGSQPFQMLLDSCRRELHTLIGHRYPRLTTFPDR